MAIEVAKVEIKSVMDASGLEECIKRGQFTADEVIAVIGKTEGNGGVNDFTRILSDQAFRAVVPFLIYFACILLYLQPRLSKLTMLGVRSADDTTTTSPMLHVGIFLVGVYGGYFGAGIGILMLAILGILAPDNLHHSNAIKGMLAMIINFTALVVFALRADVAWGPAGVMAVASIVGGYVGVHFARRISPRVLRTGIIGYGAVIATVLLLQR